MSGFADLVDQAQPALYGGGISAAATEGRTWRWQFTDAADLAGDPIDFTGVTGVCKVTTGVGGTEIIELDFDGASDGSFTISADEADTAGLFAGGTQGKARSCTWSLVLTNGTDSVQAWGPTNSRFQILTED